MEYNIVLSEQQRRKYFFFDEKKLIELLSFKLWIFVADAKDMFRLAQLRELWAGFSQPHMI